MKLKAIIIDDEPYVRDDLREMLAAHGDIEVAADRLAESIARQKLDIKPKEAGPGKSDPFKSNDSVFIKTNSGRMFVRLDEIVAISSIGGNYASLYLKNDQKLISRKTLKDWETLLPGSVYLRIHRATIINTGIDFLNNKKWEPFCARPVLETRNHKKTGWECL